MSFRVEENTNISVSDIEQVIAIYAKNGWGSDYQKEQIKKMFESLSYYCCCYDGENNLVGFLKAFSDTYSTHLFEILVLPDLQRADIGRMMMEAFMKKYSNTAIFVVGVNDTFGFYEKFGFSMKDSLYACSKKPLICD